MLINIVSEYSKEQIEFLKDTRKQIIIKLSNIEDKKKIISFLNKCWIISINEKEKKIYLWIPNEFIATQIKKFFLKKLNQIVEEIYPQFKIKLEIFSPFQNWRHPLQLDLTKLFKIKKNHKPTLSQQTKNKLSEIIWIIFDKRYKFSNFVVWSNNKLAFVAAKQVAENPWKAYNPLFIWWNVWLGKTHLLQAIGNYIIQHSEDKIVVYLPSTNLIDEIVESIRKNKLNDLINKFKQIDVLIVDDIQFLGQKEKTQEIFHNIFNELYSQSKQIILSSDVPPKLLNNLEKRLTSRFAMGLVVDIQPPDFETRLAILKQKLKEKHEELDEDILELIAENVKDNIRELEWVLNVIITQKKLLWKINKDDIKNILKNLGYNINSKEETNKSQQIIIPQSKDLNYYLKIVSNYYNLEPELVKWDSRKKEYSTARQMLMYIWRNHLWRTLERIWEFFWGKNHATVIYAINNFSKLLKKDKKLLEDFNIIINS